MRQMWGKCAAGVMLACALAAVSGCSSSGGSDDAKPAAAKVKAVSLEEATTKFQAAVTKFDTDGGCLDEEPGTCWEQMQALMPPARTLRTAMHAHKGTGAEFWSGAYVLINRMEKGVAVGEDQGGGLTNTTSNRTAVFGGAHDLSDWLDEHPAS